MTPLQYQLINKIMTSEVIDGGQLDEAAELIVTSLIAGLEIHRAGIWLYQGQQRNILTAQLIIDRFHRLRDTSMEISREQFPGYFAALDKEIVIRADDAPTNPLTFEFKHGYLDLLDIHSMLDAPIRLNGKTVGVVCCEQVGESLTWSDDAALFASLVADKFGRALAAQEKISQYKELRRTTKALAQQTDKLKALHESLDRFSLIASMDIDGNITEVNDNFLIACDYQREQLIGQPFAIFDCYLNPLNFFTNIWHQLRMGQIWQGKICKLKNGGELFWVDATISPVKNSSAQIDGYIGLFHEISHEVETENQLNKAEKLAKMGNFRCNIHTQQWSCSANLKKMLGLSEQQSLTWNYLQKVINPEHFSALREAYMTLGSSQKLDLSISLAADPSIWLHFVAQRLGSWFMGNCQDISLRVAQKDKLDQIIALQQTILDSANFTMIATTPDGIITHFNQMAEKLLGYQADEMIDLHSPYILHLQGEVRDYAQQLEGELQEDVAVGFTTLIARASKGGVDEREWTYLSKEGNTFPVSLSVTAIFDKSAQIAGYLLIGKDISQQKQAEKYSQQLSTIMTTAGDIASFSGFLYNVDSDQFQITNEHFRTVISALTGHDKIGLNDLLGLCRTEDREKIAELAERALVDARGYDFQLQLIDAEPLTIKWLRIVGNPQSENGQVTSVLGFMQDISEQKQLQDKLSEQALTDELTQLANRRALISQLDNEWRRNARYQSNAVVMIIDIDHFKKVNDQWGHDAGDFALKMFSQRLTNMLRETDSCGRFGGEEFLILISNGNEQSGLILAEKVRNLVETTPIFYTPLFQTSSVEIAMTVSIGVCGLNHLDIRSVNQWLVAADKALYTAKKNGRNRVIGYSQLCEE